jgi:hypothetical protein
MLKRSDPD